GHSSSSVSKRDDLKVRCSGREVTGRPQKFICTGERAAGVCEGARSGDDSMSPGPRGRRSSLTLVASSADAAAVGAERNANRARDWSGLMARAQDGDRHAYRALLEDMTPY